MIVHDINDLKDILILDIINLLFYRTSEEKMKVYFSGNFRGHVQGERAGKRIVLNRCFEWDGYPWRIPAVYSCSRGLVVDFCKQISLHKIRQYLEQCESRIQGKTMTADEVERMGSENPMSELLNCKALVNGRTVEGMRTCSIWYPYRSEEGTGVELMNELLEEYHCDKEQGWQFVRMSLPWPYKRKPKKITLRLLFEPYQMLYPCKLHFTKKVGDSEEQLIVCHPVTKKEYRFILGEMEAGVLPDHAFQHRKGYEFPRHYAQLNYQYEAEQGHSEFMINDCNVGDRPRQIGSDEINPNTNGASSVGIIGGSFGPSAVFVPDSEKVCMIKKSLAISSLHFEPVKEVEWRVSAFVQRGEALTLEFTI